MRRAVMAFAVLGAVAAAAAPSAAQAGCGGVRIARPRHVWRHHQRVPLAIGDSSMLLALDDLAREGFEANARGCREMDEGIHLVEKRGRYHTIPHLVVVALGADASISIAQVHRLLDLLGPQRILTLVTPRELGGWSGHDAWVCRHEAATHRDRIVLLDWVKHSAGHGSWFQPDGLHLTWTGAHAFARFLARALPFAYPKRSGRPR